MSHEGFDPTEQDLAERLSGEKPIPSAGFRGALGRWLDDRDPGYGPRPAHLGLMVAGCLAAGSAVAAIGLLVGVS